MRAFLFTCFAALLGAWACAQSPTGTISGLVFDPDAKAVAGADIILVNDLTRVQFETKTNELGLYTVPNLPPGSYRVQASKIGFKTIIRPDITVNVQDSVTVNFTLPVGATSIAITVEGGAPMINTTDGTVSTVVDHNFVENMPLNGRSFQDLILLAPGVVTATPQNSSFAGVGMTGEFSVNGQRTESNNYSLDGVGANVGVTPGLGMVSGAAGPSGSVATSTALGTTQALVSVDALEEFRVQTSSYSAEFGRNPGGQISFVSRSGTREWHGSAYDYLRNGTFDANDWFNNYYSKPQPALRQNDFGGTLGGAFGVPGQAQDKNKLFFFFSYEGLRLVQPQAATLVPVPDESLRQSAPAVLEPILNAFPAPNGPSLGNGFAGFIGTWSNPSSIDAYGIRLDYAVGDRLKLFFRFSDTPSNSASRSSAIFSQSSFLIRTYTFGTTSSFSTGIANSFRVNYTSNSANSEETLGGFAGGSSVDLNALQGLGNSGGTTFILLAGAYEPFLFQSQQKGLQRQWNLVDTVSLSVGHHSLKFGGDYRRLAPKVTTYSPSVTYVYGSEAAVENNSAFVDAQSYLSPVYPLYTNFSAFIQDEWHITPRLNLSGGLRWEVNPAPDVTEGLKPYTTEGASLNTLTLAPQGATLWDTTWFNFAPRLGAAYTVRSVSGWETVLRGGVGVFYDTGQQAGSQGFQGAGFTSLSTFSGAAFPLPPATVTPPIVNPPVPPYSDLYAFPKHLQLPYTLQWNGTLQQSLGKSQALTLSYVGAHGARLLKENELAGFENPNVTELILFQNGLTSDYDALQMQFQRRLTDGLAALGSYTWSHCLDYGSSNIQIGFERGNCNFDVRHNFSSAISYTMPALHRQGWSKTILEGWGIDDRFTVRTAFPVTLNGSTIFDPITNEFYYAGLDRVPGVPVYIYGAQCAEAYGNGMGCPGGRAVNPNAFTLASGCTSLFSCSPGAQGDAPRNFVRGFGEWQMDISVRREFSITERLRLQFRAEAFNVFNHPNFGSINAFLGQRNFGQATATLANSLGVLAPQYQLGGARSMQFTLRMAF